MERCRESGVEATSCRWVFFVEFGDLLGSVFAARRWFPSVIAVAVPFPLDQILKFLAIDARVEDFFDLVLLFAVNDVRRWWCRLFKAVIAPGAESINMYDRVDVQAGGQFKLVIKFSDAFEDFERAKLTGTEFRALLMDFNVFG